jgi:TonB family protein
MIRAVVPACFFALLTGCAVAAAQEPTGKIIIYREANSAPNGYLTPVFCDGMQVGMLASGSYQEVLASSGSHICVAGSVYSSAETIVDISPQTAAYLRVDVTGRFIHHASLTVMSSSAFENELHLTRLSKPIAVSRIQESPPFARGPQMTFDHSRRFGDLIVTPLKLSDSEGSGVMLLLGIENRGASTVCAVLASRLHTTTGHGYDGMVLANTHTSQVLSHGESTTESFSFKISSEEKPFSVDLQTRPAECPPGIVIPGRDVRTPMVIAINLADVGGSDPQRNVPASNYHEENQTFEYPSCLSCPNPSYSQSARKAKFQGMMEFQVVVEADGTAGDVQVLQSSGFADLDQKLVDTIKTWKFKPAKLPDGRPVSVSVAVETKFRLL